MDEAGGIIRPLPEIFAVFPLTGALLLPGARMPLNIFEPRYLAMVEDALGAGRVIGMIQPDRAAAAGETGPALSRVGCLGRIVSFAETEDSRYLITLLGVTRFSVAAEIGTRRGYRRVQGALGEFSDDAEDADERRTLAGFDRPALLASLRRYFGARRFEANWDAIEQMTDAALVTTLAMACPFTPPEKQALLEAPDPEARAATLRTLLEIGARDGGEPGLPS